MRNRHTYGENGSPNRACADSVFISLDDKNLGGFACPSGTLEDVGAAFSIPGVGGNWDQEIVNWADSACVRLKKTQLLNWWISL